MPWQSYAGLPPMVDMPSGRTSGRRLLLVAISAFIPVRKGRWRGYATATSRHHTLARPIMAGSSRNGLRITLCSRAHCRDGGIRTKIRIVAGTLRISMRTRRLQKIHRPRRSLRNRRNSQRRPVVPPKHQTLEERPAIRSSKTPQIFRHPLRPSSQSSPL